MKDIKCSTLRKKYNRYCKIMNILDWWYIAFLLAFFTFALAWVPNQIVATIFKAVTIFLLIYMFVGPMLNEFKAESFEEYAENKSYKNTKKVIRKNRKWLS